MKEIIAPDWLAREVAALTADLERRHPASGPGVVTAAVARAGAQLAAAAKIPNYLPVLIRRAADEIIGVVPAGVAERHAYAPKP